MQWMRHEETAWDTKGPPYVFKLRGALDAAGKVTALEYDACAMDQNHLGYNQPDTVLIAQLMGRRPAQPARGGAEAPSSMYAIPNRRTKHARHRPADAVGRRRCAPATCAIPTDRR